jgi:hypothetical protein
MLMWGWAWGVRRQLSLLHDIIHGTVTKDPSLRRVLLFWGSMPSVFG